MRTRRGFTLVEVIIMLTLSAFLLGVIGSMMTAMSNSGRVLKAESSKAAMQEAKALLIRGAKDVDGDGQMELPEAAAGQSLPTSVPVPGKDSWGVALRYCAWDLGVHNGVDPTWAHGTDAPPVAGLAGRLISAGKDGVFETGCADASGTGDDIILEIFEADIRMTNNAMGGFADDGNSIAQVTPTQPIGLGTTAAPDAKLHVIPSTGADTAILADGAGVNQYPTIAVRSFGGEDGNAKAMLTLTKMMGTKAAPSPTQGNIGEIVAYGFDGTGLVASGALQFLAETAFGPGAHPTRMRLCSSSAQAAGMDISTCTVLDSSGRLGIGIDAPRESLDIGGNLVVNGALAYFAHDGAANTANSWIGLSGTTWSFHAAQPRGAASAGGNIAARRGTLTTLNVTGADLTNGYALYVSGNAFATGTWTPSDSRLKKDIAPMHDALDVILRLNPVNYLFRKDKGRHVPDGLHSGLIAQEVAEVMPGAVKKGPDGYLAVDYMQLVPALIGAVKEQNRRIEDLERRIRKLEPGGND